MRSPAVDPGWVRALPAFDSALTALARVAYVNEQRTYFDVVDRQHDIRYRIAATKPLSPAAIRAALAVAFKRIGNSGKTHTTFAFAAQELIG